MLACDINATYVTSQIIPVVFIVSLFSLKRIALTYLRPGYTNIFKLKTLERKKEKKVRDKICWCTEK